MCHLADAALGLTIHTYASAAAAQGTGFYDRRVEAPRSVLKGDCFVHDNALLNAISICTLRPRSGLPRTAIEIPRLSTRIEWE